MTSPTDLPAVPASSIAPALTEDLADISHDFRLANARLARRLRQEKIENEVTDSQFSALRVLFTDGPLTLSQLSEHERVTPPSMNRTVNSLVDAGLIARAGASDDGRKVMLSVTAAGQVLIEETRRRRDAWLVQRVLTLTAGEQRVLAEATVIMTKLAGS
jgi:DNA-binding MarR family transcriptional regulator